MYDTKFASNYDQLIKSFDIVQTSPKGEISVFELKHSPLEVVRDLQIEFPEGTTTADTEHIVDDKTDAIKKRLDVIESRFPNESAIDKIASVNDAVLATKIEALNESIKAMREKMITRWDLVVVVFEILGAIVIIVAIIVAIL